ncbi:MAG: hypothetical protein ACOY3L_03615 [Pseudomonadota bacterium]
MIAEIAIHPAQASLDGDLPDVAAAIDPTDPGLAAEGDSELSEQPSSEQPASEESSGDDTEEVEHDGQTYRVPKALKGALMMHADYTRKTQEVAAQRRALEEASQRFLQQVQAQQEHLRDHAGLAAIDQQLAALAGIDWAALAQQNPAEAQRLQGQAAQLAAARQALVSRLQQAEQQKALDAQRLHARCLEDGHAVLARDIPNWSAETAAKLNDFAAALGFSPEEIGQVLDPRQVKVLHLAWLGQQLQQKHRAATETPAASPVPQLGTGSAPGPRDPSRMSTDQWIKWRNASLRKKR